MAQVLVQRACAKLRSAIAKRSSFTGDLQETLDALEVIQPVLEKGEMQLLGRIFSTGWLKQVKHAAYRIIDMVDELQDRRPPAAATITKMFPRLAIKMNAMKNEVIRLKEYCHSYISVQKFTQLQYQAMDERETVPCFKEAWVIGRGLDKQRIVAVLLSAASDIFFECTILPIYGFAGSGKTTLARMVFNDDTHQQYSYRVWIYVSPELDLHGICKSILYQVVSEGGEEKEEINDHGSNSDVVEMESTMNHLHELLNGKKVLLVLVLVLDDLWEEDSIQLQLLKSMLTFLSDKVYVIVTTCNQAIARKICTVEPYSLNPLGHDEWWQIIKKSVRFEVQEELEKIRPEIASKCWGLPSVARALAGILDSRDPRTPIWIRERDAWKYTWKGWDYFFGDNLESLLLISTLEFCYMSMPQDLRLCFAYFAIFPIGHNIAKDDLIHQWIALRLIEPTEILMSATQIAEEYITRLLDMSFIQTTKSNPARVTDYKGAVLFTMHELAHILARILTGSDHYMLKNNHSGNLGNDVDARALHCVGCSRVEFNDDSFSSRGCLRVLELKESSVQKLPDSIWQLRYLGYLKITYFSGLVTLPESLSGLTNLFHINLSGCSGLVNLPESFGKLIRLVHVNLSGCSGLTTLPGSFGNLVNLLHIDLSRCHRLLEILETLKKLVKLVYLDLSSWSCFKGIDKCLGGLTNLEHLNLSKPCCYLPQHCSHLQGLKDGLCKLTSLRYLNLSMCMNPILYYHKSQEESLHYIESSVSGLSNLEHLDLSDNTFLADLPQSLGNLNKLHTLDLSGCTRLKKLGQMKALKFIALRNCRGLESCNFVVRIVDVGDAYRSSSNIVQLEDVDCEELQISCLENVRSQEEAQRIKLVEKQKLQKLKLSWTLDSIRSVEDSALLGELTPPSNVQCLEINGYDGTCLPEYLGDLTFLRELKIDCCKKLKSLPDSIQKLTSLKDLCILDCPELEKWCQLEENKKMLAHNYEQHSSTSSSEIEEDCRSINEV